MINESSIAAAWATANFNAATKTKAGLRPLSHYLQRTAAPQTPSEQREMLTRLSETYKLPIRRVKRSRLTRG